MSANSPRRRRNHHVARLTLLVAAAAAPAWRPARPAFGDGPDPAGPVDPAGDGAVDPAVDDGTLQRLLDAPDDEWQVLRPRVVRVLQLRRAAGIDRPAGIDRSADGGDLPGPAPADPPPAAVTDPSTAAARLAAVRATRRQAAADLAVADRDLTDLLTRRQEAALVLAGVLD